jgi:zinc-binding alcohol dehydrogenase family protein
MAFVPLARLSSESIMKAVGYFEPLPIYEAEALLDLELPEPTLSEHDLLVSVKAVSVNPVDTKVRAGRPASRSRPQVLGWDAAGVVEAVGAKVIRFKPGDRVWYAGDLNRAGSNAERQTVDERIAGPMPARIGFAEAAALPLTAITAWELLFDRLRVQDADPTANNCLLIIGAAGGVGSILVQLARRLTGLTVIASASRRETREWVMEMGAHHTIDHGMPWKEQLKELGFEDVTHVVSLNHTDTYLAQIVDVLRPEGQMALIDDPKVLDIAPLKNKSLSAHWEFMFTRSLFKTSTQSRQQELLNRVATLVDMGTIRSTMTERVEGIRADNLKAVHAQIESGGTRGKIVIEGF